MDRYEPLPPAYTADARSDGSWVYWDLDEEKEVGEADAGWDIAFQQLKVVSNQGGGVEVAVLDGQQFGSVKQAPPCGYLESADGLPPEDAANEADPAEDIEPAYDIEPEDDAVNDADMADGADPTPEPDAAPGTDGDMAEATASDDETDLGTTRPIGWLWYRYAKAGDGYSPRNVVYVVHTTDDRYFEVSIADYYDEEGEEGVFSFYSSAVTEPTIGQDCNASGPRIEQTDDTEDFCSSVVNAKSFQTWVYWDLDAPEQAYPLVPDQDSDWDIAVRRNEIVHNGGSHGGGGVEVAIVNDADFDSLERAPADGYLAGDAQDAPWDWQDPLSERPQPKEEQLYVVRSTAGVYFKLAIESYSGAELEFRCDDLDPPEDNQPDEPSDELAPL